MAWTTPITHQAAFHAAMSIAPIDQSQGVNNSMSRGMSAEAGGGSGALTPGTTAGTAPVGAASPIRMKVNPHLKRGSVPHTLVGSMLK